MHSGAGRRWGAPHIAAAGDVLCGRNNKSHHITSDPLQSVYSWARLIHFLQIPRYGNQMTQASWRG